MKSIIKYLFIFINFLFISYGVSSLPISTSAKYALIIDYQTGNILFDKNANQRVYPASMSKLMTLYLLFEALSDGSVDLETTFTVSKKAWRKGGSKMFVEQGSNVKVEDLLQGIIVQSGNDACIVVAEGLAGDEDNFSNLMNEKASELGLNDSNFKNSTGWPDKEHYMSLYDLAILSKRIIQDFPEFFHLFKEKEFTYNNIKQNNRNPLLYSYQFSDGLKTGYTEESGFSLAATALKGDTRVIVILSGMNTMIERKKEATKLFDWSFREFKNIKLFSKEESVMQADVWLGKKELIDLYSTEDVMFTVKRKNLKSFQAKIVYNTPIPAPIKKNTEYAKLIITDTLKGDIEYPLYAKEEFGKAGFFKKLSSAFSYLVFGGYAD